MSDPETIYLQPSCCADPSVGRVWCDDIPEECDDGVEWTEYVRADGVHYTDEPPTQPGYYWIKWDWDGMREEIVGVYPRPGHSYLAILMPERHPRGKREFLPVVKLNAQWSGPIRQPVTKDEE